MRNQVSLVVLCVSLLVLAACGNTANPLPTATPTPTTPTVYKTPAAGLTVYTSPDHKYKISYPTGWQVDVAGGNPGKVDFSGPNQDFQVSDKASAAKGVDPAQLITEWCNAIGQTTSHVRGTPVVLAGQTWFKAECGDDAHPAEPLIVEVVTYHGVVYQIDYSSPAASFQADGTTYYAPMQQSFQFLT